MSLSGFNQKPILVVAPMTQSFWTILRGLGVLAVNQGKPIQPKSITWNDPGGGASCVITDGVGTSILFSRDTPADFVGADPFYDLGRRQWRDWQVTVLTGGSLEIDY